MDTPIYIYVLHIILKKETRVHKKESRVMCRGENENALATQTDETR